MTSRSFRSFCVVGIMLSLVGAASAECISDFIKSIGVDTKRRNCWPHPFVCPDRQAVRAPFAVMIANGWERQNMLDDYHFEQGSGELTEAGRLKVRSIVYDAPEQHRQVYVHRVVGPEMAERMRSVQTLVAQLCPEGNMPPVLPTEMPHLGWPAEQVDRVTRKYAQAMPEPKLPQKDESTQPK